MDFEIENGVLKKYHGNETEIVIPDGVTCIGESAFRGCENLISVTIPDSVTSIGENAFWWCSSLTSVTIPDSVTSIGEGAFEACRSLTSVTIPNSVTSIGKNAFYECSSLTSITIPDSVTSIGVRAFGGCSNLTAVTIPDSVTSTGVSAFGRCSSLTSLHWRGKCNAAGITHKNRETFEINRALEMVKSKDFSVQFDNNVKFPFIVGMYKETKDVDALTYIIEHFMEIVPVIIKCSDTEGIQALLDIDGLFTQDNIDEFLELAIAKEQHEIYTLLVNYKAEKLGFMDLEDRFKL